jgi:DNA-binding response OmpR family regulator
MKKIVLIEDDADLFSLIQYNLEKEGFALAGSKTGKGAIDLCRREKPDLIILDIMLPDSMDSKSASPSVRILSFLPPL